MAISISFASYVVGELHFVQLELSLQGLFVWALNAFSLGFLKKSFSGPKLVFFFSKKLVTSQSQCLK